jgi:glycosyltransferase involved in cell wall biosynthesis
LPLAQALVRSGRHQAMLAVPPWDWPADAGRIEDRAGVPVVHIALPPAVPLLRDVLIMWRLLRTVRAWRPDVVHCCKPKGYGGLVLLAYWLGRRLGLTRARLVVDTDDWEGPGGWNERGDYSPAQRLVFRWQEPWLLRHADAVTVASKALAEMVAALGVPAERIHYLPNGVGWQAEWPVGDGAAIRARHGLGDRPVMLLYTRFFEFQAARVVSVFARVVEEMPDADARLLVVGKGLAGEEVAFAEQLAARGLGERAVMVGWVDAAEVPHYLAAGDVAIYPLDDTLLNRTKCPVKLVDLMAAGRPVVAERVGQAAEYIQDVESGVLVPGGDEVAFAEGVVNLLRDPDRRQRMGVAARQRIWEYFNWDRLAQVAEQAYGFSGRRFAQIFADH